ncbi:hypothetical protein Q7I27_18275 [Aeromonas veronii]|uniref:hypothetical protein n=1 Tax=Aeromonas veronii TaxID=654 RepID=UPI00300618C2
MSHKGRLRALLVLSTWCVVLYCFSVFGMWKILLAPFMPLEEKIALRSYFAYSGILVLVPFCLWHSVHLIRQLLAGVESPVQSSWGMMVPVSIITLFLLGFAPRYYLSKRLDAAGYVECAKEYQSGYRGGAHVFAATPELCKE